MSLMKFVLRKGGCEAPKAPPTRTVNVEMYTSPGGFDSEGVKGSLLLKMGGKIVFKLDPRGGYYINHDALGELRDGADGD